MSNFNLSPSMNLPIPTVGVDAGPDWANNVNACLSIVDSHTHIPGSGVQITPAAININSDLPFNNNNNATTLRSARFTAQASPLALAADIGCLYVSGVDLYYNDISGNQVRVTQGGSVAGSTGTITGLPSGTASAAYAAGTFTFQQATSTGANLDVASIAIRYPGSYPTPSGNYILLQAPSSLASGYSLTLPALPAANNTFMTMSTAGVIATALTVDNSTLAISGSNIIIKDGGVTNVKLAALGQQMSSTSGVFNTSSATFVQVTNLTVTITTTGRPVRLALQSDTVINEDCYFQQTTPNKHGYIRFVRDVTTVSVSRYGDQEVPSSAYSFLDTPPAGTYTYKCQIRDNDGTGVARVSNSVLIAYEV